MQATNPAINAGNMQSCYGSTDQRGVNRVGICDIGAYEYANPGSAESLLILDGDDQRTPPTFTLSTALKVIALDNQGSPAPGVNVFFTAPDAGPSLSFASTNTNVSSVVTDMDGVASSSDLVANDQLGDFMVSASASSIGTVYFSLENGALYVAPAGNDANDCLTPTSPCSTISGAINKTQKGDTVLVAMGIYNQSNSISVSKDLILLGGWNSNFTSQIGQSTIQGGIGVGTLDDNQRTHVLMRNLTIAGRVNGAGLTNSGILIFQNGSVINNYMGVDNYGDLTILNSTISGNGFTPSPPPDGGGLSNRNPSGYSEYPRAISTIINSTITNNKAHSGGGISNNGSAAGTGSAEKQHCCR